MRDRRLKIVLVDVWQTLRLFTRMQQGDVIRLPRFTGVPDDVEVLDVHYSERCRAFEFCIRHPSFPETAPGTMLEAICADEVTVIGADFVPAGQPDPLVLDVVDAAEAYHRRNGEPEAARAVNFVGTRIRDLAKPGTRRMLPMLSIEPPPAPGPQISWPDFYSSALGEVAENPGVSPALLDVDPTTEQPPAPKPEPQKRTPWEFLGPPR